MGIYLKLYGILLQHYLHGIRLFRNVSGHHDQQHRQHHEQHARQHRRHCHQWQSTTTPNMSSSSSKSTPPGQTWCGGSGTTGYSTSQTHSTSHQQQQQQSPIHPEFLTNLHNGMDFLREIGTTVQQALVNIGMCNYAFE